MRVRLSGLRTVLQHVGGVVLSRPHRSYFFSSLFFSPLFFSSRILLFQISEKNRIVRSAAAFFSFLLARVRRGLWCRVHVSSTAVVMTSFS